MDMRATGRRQERPTILARIKVFLYAKMLQSMDWGERRVRPGYRWMIGVLFIIGGLFGFLPILGFWMIPVGITYIVLEFPKNRTRLRAWLQERVG
jgi:hypothetical protein